jgi:hypothetical protein
MKTITKKITESGLKSRPEPLGIEMQMQFDFAATATGRGLQSGDLLALLRGFAARIINAAVEILQPHFVAPDFASRIALSGMTIMKKLHHKILNFQR